MSNIHNRAILPVPGEITRSPRALEAAQNREGRSLTISRRDLENVTPVAWKPETLRDVRVATALSIAVKSAFGKFLPPAQANAVIGSALSSQEGDFALNLADAIPKVLNLDPITTRDHVASIMAEMKEILSDQS